jgi:PHD/YefM family antitoxin component YafN of YafNO toxin-antitoxin module
MNGRAQVVIQDAESYQNMMEMLERAKAVEAIREGLVDVDQGKTMSLEDFDKEVRRKHRILQRK